jgi:two-component system cell cycle response regulator
MGARVLVVEDNAPNLELMTYLLRAFGHEPIVARDGAEGLARALAGGVDAVICDIQLPKLDGYGVAHGIRESDRARAVPLIAVTAFAMAGDRERVLAAGFDGYITKPIVPETFVLQVDAFLPLEQRSQRGPIAAELAAPVTAPPPSGGRKRILAVDNIPDNLALMRGLLEPFGYEVTTARSRREAMSVLSSLTPDLIISDLHMEDGSGYEFLEDIRQHPALVEVPFVFISSTARSSAESARGLSLGARKFIIRPVDSEVLLAEIEECLRGRR